MDVSRRRISDQNIYKSSRLVTSQLGNFSRLIVDLKLGGGKSSEAGGVGLEKFLEDLASLFNDDLSRRVRLTSKEQKLKRRSELIARNRPESRGLHPVGALARTHQKKSLPI